MTQRQIEPTGMTHSGKRNLSLCFFLLFVLRLSHIDTKMKHMKRNGVIPPFLISLSFTHPSCFFFVTVLMFPNLLT
ncbi:MAG: hypothetical protein J3R72DRAFT_430626 [Linnemannia gamsii]|nr:MAG: hypothetical protein J3R72DRAFT_430626 [Linnemannia gamsii]